MMYIDIDSRSTYSIVELSRSELNLLQRALATYARYNLGYINGDEVAKIRKFDYEFKTIKNEETLRQSQKQKMDKG